MELLFSNLNRNLLGREPISKHRSRVECQPLRHEGYILYIIPSHNVAGHHVHRKGLRTPSLCLVLSTIKSRGD